MFIMRTWSYIIGQVKYNGEKCPSNTKDVNSEAVSVSVLYSDMPSINSWQLYVQFGPALWVYKLLKVKVKVSAQRLDIHVTKYTCSSDFTSPGSGRTAACNYWSTLDLCISYLLWLGGPRECGIQSFARRFYTWPALGIEPQTFWYWIQHPIHLTTCSLIMQNNTCIL